MIGPNIDIIYKHPLLKWVLKENFWCIKLSLNTLLLDSSLSEWYRFQFVTTRVGKLIFLYNFLHWYASPTAMLEEFVTGSRGSTCGAIVSRFFILSSCYIFTVNLNACFWLCNLMEVCPKVEVLFSV